MLSMADNKGFDESEVRKTSVAVLIRSPTQADASPSYEDNMKSRPWTIGCGPWMKKYFWEGQALQESHKVRVANISDDDPFYIRWLGLHRRIIGLILPAAFFQFFWWAIAINYNIWHLFADKYFMSITMIFGSLIAGMTSEGGGAIAFPVMTLAFSIAPAIARDFSLMIQSCGMTAAAFTIFFMNIQLEWHALILCSFGGMVGIIFGFHCIDPNLTPPQKKILFVSIWFSFAFALFLLNRYHKRRTFHIIPEFKLWKGIVLFISGCFGGMFSSFAGSGIDICSFSILTLLFRVSEKTATPTSVVLMAGNTCIGFFWRQIIMQEVSQEAWEFLAVCFPIVVIGAPLGSVLGSHFHRQVLAAFVYIVDISALIGAYVLVKMTTELIIMTVCIIVFGLIFFGFLTYTGQRIMGKISHVDSEESIRIKCSESLC